MSESMSAPMGDEGFMPKHKMKSSLIYPELGQTMAEETLKRQQAIVVFRTGNPRFILYRKIHG